MCCGLCFSSGVPCIRFQTAWLCQQGGIREFCSFMQPQKQPHLVLHRLRGRACAHFGCNAGLEIMRECVSRWHENAFRQMQKGRCPSPRPIMFCENEISRTCGPCSGTFPTQNFARLQSQSAIRSDVVVKASNGSTWLQDIEGFIFLR